MYQTSGQYQGSRRNVEAMSQSVSPSFTTYWFGAPEASGTGSLTCCTTGWPWDVDTVLPRPASIDDEPDGIVVARGAGGGASSSSAAKGLSLFMVLQPAMEIASAATASVRPFLRRYFRGDIIDGRSITVVRVCPLAGVAIICRVVVGRDAKHVTIPAQRRVWQPRYQAALSAILFNKVKNLGAICRSSH